MSNPNWQIDLHTRTQDACTQLERYGYIFSHELADIVWLLTDINDDLWHGREPAGIKADIRKCRELLDALEKSV